MAYVTKNDQMRYIEFGNFVVDYSDGDVLVPDCVKDLTPLYPLKPSTMLIGMCTKGKQMVTVNGHDIDIVEGSVLFCPPNVRMAVGESSDGFECKVLCISEHLVRGLLRDRIDIFHHALYPHHLCVVNIPKLFMEEFGLYFSLIRFKLKRTTPVTPNEILLVLLRALLLEMCSLLESNNGVKRDHKLSQGKVLFNRFLSLISNSQVKRQPITVYAGQLAITPKYLTMLCMKYSDKTASQWVAQYTVEEIRFYLKNTDLSIKEISARLGFSNMSHFGSYVRKHLGVSPSEYRFSKKE